MGFKPWRTLSVLLLASAALVGCNNTAQKDKSLGAAPKVVDPLAKAPANQVPGPVFPNGAKTAFPMSGNSNVSPFDPQKSSFPMGNSGSVQPAGGQGSLNNSSPAWPPPSNPGNNGMPSLPPQNSFGPPPGPTPASNFGVSRVTTPDSLPTGTPPIGPPPANFNGGR